MSTVPAAEHQAGSVLFGQTRRRVLGWLLGHADEAYYLRQIVRQTGGAQGAVQRELEALTRAGVLRRTVQGRQVYFQANRASPIFPELQSLVLKTAGVVEILREALGPLHERIRAAFVFGSAACVALHYGSDIDLLIVGDASFEEVAASLADAQSSIGRDVNPTVYPVREFRKKLREGHHFLTTVLTEPKTFVIGDENELGRVGAEPVVDRTPNQRGRSSRLIGRHKTGPRRQRR
jgi:predicted nucleotidyltransferase